MSFIMELQRGVAPLWEKMVTHRFVQELGDGTLPWEKFQRYFEQDYVFLRQGWIHMISLAIAKSPDFDKARTLTRIFELGVGRGRGVVSAGVSGDGDVERGCERAGGAADDGRLR